MLEKVKQGKRGNVRLVILCVLFIGFSAPLLTSENPAAQEASSAEKQKSVKSQRTLTILHTNDLHGHLEPWQGWEGELAGKTIGGLDHLATAIKQARTEVGSENSLLLDAGDTLGDTMIAQETKGRVILEVMNAVEYDAMVIGNHELDFTVEILRERIRDASFPVLAANIIESASGQHFTQPYLIRDLGGVKVGVLGMAYPNTPVTTAQKNVTGLEFRDALSTAREFIPQLRQAGVQVLIVLSHYGLGADKQLAERAPGIDVIVGGHSHNRMQQALQIQNTLIVQAGAHGSDLGRLELTVDAEGRIVGHTHRLILLDNATIPADPAIKDLLKSATESHQAQLRMQIGSAAAAIVRAQTLAGQEARQRDAESPADFLFADIVRDETKSEIALLPGVGYGVPIPSGPITAAALRNLIPHESHIVTMTLSGAQIQEILEQAVENVLTDEPQQKVGGMIQVSGARFRYDPDAPAFQRVRDIRVEETPLVQDRRYRVATNTLLAEGGHKYRTFLDGQERQEHEKQYEMVQAWISRQRAVQVPSLGRILRSSARL